MLTAKQERFAQLIASEDISQVAAYVDAGYQSAAQRKTLTEGASRLAADSNVSARVDEIRQQALEAGALPELKASAAELDRLKKLAIGDKNYGAGVRCEELRGKLAGHYIDRVRDETPADIPAEDAITELCTQNGVVHETARVHFMKGLEALKTPYTPIPIPEPTQHAPDMVQ